MKLQSTHAPRIDKLIKKLFVYNNAVNVIYLYLIINYSGECKLVNYVDVNIKMEKA